MTDRRTLTAVDVRALREADSFYVWIDGTIAQVHLTKRARRRTTAGPFTGATLDGEYTMINDLASTQTGSGGTMYAPASLRALGLIVRPGDWLRWTIRTNNNGYTAAAIIPAGRLGGDFGDVSGYDALFNDELTVTVVRHTKAGHDAAIVRDLVMAYSLTPDNSARMARPVHPLTKAATA